MSVRIWAALGVALLFLGAIGAMINYIRNAERNVIRIDGLETQVKTEQHQSSVNQTVAVETDAFGQRRETLNREATNARRVIEAQVGADTPIPPDLARAALCRIERLRGTAQANCPDRQD